MGLSNNGRVRLTSPLHLEAYQAIVRLALERVIRVGGRPDPVHGRVTFGTCLLYTSPSPRDS